MPKQKTHRASAKRFKRTGSGGLKRFRAFTSHRFHGKTKKQRRHLRKAGLVSRRFQTYQSNGYWSLILKAVDIYEYYKNYLKENY